jgi:hypothetical protein
MAAAACSIFLLYSLAAVPGSSLSGGALLLDDEGGGMAAAACSILLLYSVVAVPGRSLSGGALFLEGYLLGVKVVSKCGAVGGALTAALFAFAVVPAKYVPPAFAVAPVVDVPPADVPAAGGAASEVPAAEGPASTGEDLANRYWGIGSGISPAASTHSSLSGEMVPAGWGV